MEVIWAFPPATPLIRRGRVLHPWDVRRVARHAEHVLNVFSSPSHAHIGGFRLYFRRHNTFSYTMECCWKFSKSLTMVADIGLLSNTVTECGNVTQALAFNRGVFWFNASEWEGQTFPNQYRSACSTAFWHLPDIDIFGKFFFCTCTIICTV